MANAKRFFNGNRYAKNVSETAHNFCLAPKLNNNKTPDRDNAISNMSCIDASHLKKYATRNSPPFPANECCGQILPGNEAGDNADRMYESRPDKNGVCRWYIVPQKKSAKGKKKTSAKAKKTSAKGKKKTSAKAKKTAAKRKASVSLFGSPSKAGAKAGAKRKRSAKGDDGDRVKRARSAYIFYSIEQQKHFADDVPVTERAKQIGASWKKLSAAAKKPYLAKAAKDKARAARERAKTRVKGARSAYNFYTKEQHQHFADEVPLAERAEQIGASWKKLSAAEKKPYLVKAAKDKVRAARERAAMQK